MSTTTDPRPGIALALDQAGRIIDAVDPSQYGLPTPCEDYDVQTLLGHFIAVIRRIDVALRGGIPMELPTIVTGIDDYPAEWKILREALDGTLAPDDVLARTCTLPWGVAPGAAAIGGYTGEVTTHGWDLATAIGRTDLLDEDLARVCLPMIRQLVPAEQRGGPIPFAPVVDVPADAPVYDQLAGWMGRKPR